MTTPTHHRGSRSPLPSPLGRGSSWLGPSLGIVAAAVAGLIFQTSFAVAMFDDDAPSTTATTAPAESSASVAAPSRTAPGSATERCAQGMRDQVDGVVASTDPPVSCVGLSRGDVLSVLTTVAAEYGITIEPESTTTPEPTELPELAETPEPTVEPEPEGPSSTIFDDGTYLVGEDIKPGTYKAAAAETCYWARLKNADGDLDSILANNIGEGRQVVTIRKSDYAFETTGCGIWERR